VDDFELDVPGLRGDSSKYDLFLELGHGGMRQCTPKGTTFRLKSNVRDCMESTSEGGTPLVKTARRRLPMASDLLGLLLA
jgi:hypothetical protein